MTSEDRARGVLAQLQAAGDARDLDRMVGCFHPDGVLIGTTAYNQGAEEIRAYLAVVVAQEESLRWDLPRMDVHLEEGAVLGCSGEGDIVVTTSDDEERVPFRLTLVAEDVGGHWLIRHFHGSTPDDR